MKIAAPFAVRSTFFLARVLPSPLPPSPPLPFKSDRQSCSDCASFPLTHRRCLFYGRPPAAEENLPSTASESPFPLPASIRIFCRDDAALNLRIGKGSRHLCSASPPSFPVRMRPPPPLFRRQRSLFLVKVELSLSRYLFLLPPQILPVCAFKRTRGAFLGEVLRPPCFFSPPLLM